MQVPATLSILIWEQKCGVQRKRSDIISRLINGDHLIAEDQVFGQGGSEFGGGGRCFLFAAELR